MGVKALMSFILGQSFKLILLLILAAAYITRNTGGITLPLKENCVSNELEEDNTCWKKITYAY